MVAKKIGASKSARNSRMPQLNLCPLAVIGTESFSVIPGCAVVFSLFRFLPYKWFFGCAIRLFLKNERVLAMCSMEQC